MGMSKFGLGIAIAAVFATAAIAEEKATTVASAAPAPVTKVQTARDYCHDLVSQFSAADTHAVSPASLADAKDHASRGEMLCGTMPKTGVKELYVAFRTIGVTPK
jgi:hypothetical protein